VSGDVPADVETVLCQLFAAGRKALDNGEVETCRQTVDSAESVATNKLPAGRHREWILHGCWRVRSLLTEAETTAAKEYLSAMERRVE